MFVEFCIYRKRSLVQYIAVDQKAVKMLILQGNDLAFKFVSGDGTQSQFGKLKSVFT